MVKSELCKLLAKKLPNLPEADILQATNLLIEFMRTNITSAGRIEIRGFGSLSLHYRQPRKSRNPRTGEILIAPGKYRPRFKPGKELRDRINKKT